MIRHVGVTLDENGEARHSLFSDEEFDPLAVTATKVLRHEGGGEDDEDDQFRLVDADGTATVEPGGDHFADATLLLAGGLPSTHVVVELEA